MLFCDKKTLLIYLYSMCTEYFCFPVFLVLSSQEKFFDGMDDDGSEFTSANSF